MRCDSVGLSGKWVANNSNTFRCAKIVELEDEEEVDEELLFADALLEDAGLFEPFEFELFEPLRKSA